MAENYSIDIEFSLTKSEKAAIATLERLERQFEQLNRAAQIEVRFNTQAIDKTLGKFTPGASSSTVTLEMSQSSIDRMAAASSAAANKAKNDCLHLCPGSLEPLTKKIESVELAIENQGKAQAASAQSILQAIVKQGDQFSVANKQLAADLDKTFSPALKQRATAGNAANASASAERKSIAKASRDTAAAVEKANAAQKNSQSLFGVIKNSVFGGIGNSVAMAMNNAIATWQPFKGIPFLDQYKPLENFFSAGITLHPQTKEFFGMIESRMTVAINNVRRGLLESIGVRVLESVADRTVRKGLDNAYARKTEEKRLDPGLKDVEGLIGKLPLLVRQQEALVNILKTTRGKDDRNETPSVQELKIDRNDLDPLINALEKRGENVARDVRAAVSDELIKKVASDDGSKQLKSEIDRLIYSMNKFFNSKLSSSAQNAVADLAQPQNVPAISKFDTVRGPKESREIDLEVFGREELEDLRLAMRRATDDAKLFGNTISDTLDPIDDLSKGLRELIRSGRGEILPGFKEIKPEVEAVMESIKQLNNSIERLSKKDVINAANLRSIVGSTEKLNNNLQEAYDHIFGLSNVKLDNLRIKPIDKADISETKDAIKDLKALANEDIRITADATSVRSELFAVKQLVEEIRKDLKKPIQIESPLEGVKKVLENVFSKSTGIGKVIADGLKTGFKDGVNAAISELKRLQIELNKIRGDAKQPIALPELKIPPIDDKPIEDVRNSLEKLFSVSDNFGDAIADSVVRSTNSLSGLTAVLERTEVKLSSLGLGLETSFRAAVDGSIAEVKRLTVAIDSADTLRFAKIKDLRQVAEPISGDKRTRAPYELQVLLDSSTLEKQTAKILKDLAARLNIEPVSGKLKQNYIDALKQFGSEGEDSAARVDAAWRRTEKSFIEVQNNLQAKAENVGAAIVDAENHRAADTVAAAWKRTQDVFIKVQDILEDKAVETGQAINKSFDKVEQHLKTIDLSGTIEKQFEAGVAASRDFAAKAGAAVDKVSEALRSKQPSLAFEIDPRVTEQVKGLEERLEKVGRVGKDAIGKIDDEIPEVRASIDRLGDSVDRAKSNLAGLVKGGVGLAAFGGAFALIAGNATEMAQSIFQVFQNVSGSIASISKNAIEEYGKVESSVKNITAVMGLNAAETKKISSAIKATAIDSSNTINTDDIAKAAASLAKANQPIDQIVAGLPKLAIGATATGISMEKFTKSFIDVKSKLNVSTEDTGKAIDIYTRMLTSTNMTEQQASYALKYLNVQKTGIEGLKEASKTIIAFSETGIRGSKAGTDLNAVVRELTSGLDGTTKKAANQRAILQELGLEYKDAAGDLKPMSELMPQLGLAYKKMADEVGDSKATAKFQELFGTKGVSAVKAYSTVALDRLKQIEKGLDDAVSGGGLSEKLALIAQGGVTGAKVAIENAFSGFNVAYGEALSKPLAGIGVSFSDAIKSVSVDSNFQAITDLGNDIDALFKTDRMKEFQAAINAALGEGLRLAIGGVVGMIREVGAALGGTQNLAGSLSLAFNGFISLMLTVAGGLKNLAVIGIQVADSLSGAFQNTFGSDFSKSIDQLGMLADGKIDANGSKELVGTITGTGINTQLQQNNVWIESALADLATGWAQISKALTPVMEAIDEMTKALLPPLLSGLTSIFSIVGSILQPVGYLLSMVIKGITIYILPTFTRLAVYLKAAAVVLQPISDIISAIFSVGNNAMSVALGSTQAFFGSLNGGMIKLLTLVQKNFFDPLGRFILSGVKGLQNLVRGFQPVINTLASISGFVAGLGVSSASLVFKQLPAIAGNLGKLFGNSALLTSKLVTQLSGAGSLIANIFKGISPQLRAVLVLIGDFSQKLFVVFAKFGTMAGTIGSGVSNMFAGILGKFSKGGDDAGNEVIKLSTRIRRGFQDVFLGNFGRIKLPEVDTSKIKESIVKAFQDAVSAIPAILGSITGGLGSILGIPDIGGAISKQFPQVKGAIATITNILGGIGGGLIGNIVDSFGRLSNEVVKTAAYFSSLLKPAIDAVSKVFSDLGREALKIWNSVAPVVMPVLTSVVKTIGDILGQVGTILGPIGKVLAVVGAVAAAFALFNPVTGVILAIGAGLVLASKSLSVMAIGVAAIRTAFVAAAGVIQVAWTTAIAAIKIAWELGKAVILIGFGAIATAWTVATTGIKVIFESLIALFTGDWGKVGKIIQDGAKDILAIWTTVGPGIMDSLGGAFNALVEWGGNVFNIIKDTVGKLIGEVGNIINTAFASIGVNLSSALAPVGQFFGDLGLGIAQTGKDAADGFKAGWDGTSEFFNDLGLGITQTAQDIWNLAVTYITDRWNQFISDYTVIAEAIGTAWNATVAIVQEAWNVVVTYLTDRWNQFISDYTIVAEAIGAKWSQLVAGIQEAWNLVVTYLTDRWNQFLAKMAEVISAASQMWNSYVAFLNNAWNGAVTAIGIAFQKTMSYVGSIAQTAAQAVVNGFTQAANAIGNVFSNIGQGMVNFFRPVLDIVGNIASTLQQVQSFGSSVVGAFQGARADGGPVVSNKIALVGERGPELFVPKTDGYIIPNHAIDGFRADGGPVTAGKSYVVGEIGTEAFIPGSGKRSASFTLDFTSALMPILEQLARAGGHLNTIVLNTNNLKASVAAILPGVKAEIANAISKIPTGSGFSGGTGFSLIAPTATSSAPQTLDQKISAGLALATPRLKASEGFRANAYDDGTGVMTIGYGETRSDIVGKGRITESEAAKLMADRLAKDYLKPALALLSQSTKDKLTPGQIAAIASFAYNTGIGGFQKSSFGSALIKGDISGAKQALPTSYINAGTNVEQGLRNRRQDELKLFNSTEGASVSGSIGKALGGNALGDEIVANAMKWVGKEFRPGVLAQCQNFVTEVLNRTKSGIADAIGVTGNALDGLASGDQLASRFFGKDKSEIFKNISDARPGDLVAFNGTYKPYGMDTITHVGIYAGNGQIIDRSTDGQPVKLRSIDTFGKGNYTFARPKEFGKYGGPSVVNGQQSQVPNFQNIGLPNISSAQLALPNFSSGVQGQVNGLEGLAIKSDQKNAIDILNAQINSIKGQTAATNKAAGLDKAVTRVEVEQKDYDDLIAKLKNDEKNLIARQKNAVRNALERVAGAKTAKTKSAAEGDLAALKGSQARELDTLKLSAASRERKALESLNAARTALETLESKNQSASELAKLKELKALQTDYYAKKIDEVTLRQKLEKLGISVEKAAIGLVATGADLETALASLSERELKNAIETIKDAQRAGDKQIFAQSLTPELRKGLALKPNDKIDIAKLTELLPILEERMAKIGGSKELSKLEQILKYNNINLSSSALQAFEAKYAKVLEKQKYDLKSLGQDEIDALHELGVLRTGAIGVDESYINAAKVGLLAGETVSTSIAKSFDAVEEARAVLAKSQDAMVKSIEVATPAQIPTIATSTIKLPPIPNLVAGPTADQIKAIALEVGADALLIQDALQRAGLSISSNGGKVIIPTVPEIEAILKTVTPKAAESMADQIKAIALKTGTDALLIQGALERAGLRAVGGGGKGALPTIAEIQGILNTAVPPTAQTLGDRIKSIALKTSTDAFAIQKELEKSGLRAIGAGGKGKLPTITEIQKLLNEKPSNIKATAIAAIKSAIKPTTTDPIKEAIAKVGRDAFAIQKELEKTGLRAIGAGGKGNLPTIAEIQKLLNEKPSSIKATAIAAIKSSLKPTTTDPIKEAIAKAGNDAFAIQRELEKGGLRAIGATGKGKLPTIAEIQGILNQKPIATTTAAITPIIEAVAKAIGIDPKELAGVDLKDAFALQKILEKSGLRAIGAGGKGKLPTIAELQKAIKGATDATTGLVTGAGAVASQAIAQLNTQQTEMEKLIADTYEIDAAGLGKLSGYNLSIEVQKRLQDKGARAIGAGAKQELPTIADINAALTKKLDDRAANLATNKTAEGAPTALPTATNAPPTATKKIAFTFEGSGDTVSRGEVEGNLRKFEQYLGSDEFLSIAVEMVLSALKGDSRALLFNGLL